LLRRYHSSQRLAEGASAKLEIVLKASFSLLII